MQKSKWLAGALSAALLVGLSTGADAAQLDRYSAMLAAHQCTIRYENVTPGERMHTRDSVQLDWTYRLQEPPEYVNQKYSGTIVLAGERRFLDIDYGSYAKSVLTKDGKNYLFSRTVKKDKVKYTGTDGKSVRPTDYDLEGALVEGEDFGPENVSRLFSAMLPADKKPLGLPDYHYVGEGSLAGGLHYEDYRTSNASGLEAVRYYFSSGNLVKIAAASYARRPDGNLDSRKCVLKINEFTDVPDETVLTLPSSLKEDK